MKRELEMNVKEYAHYEGVTQRTVWNWIQKGSVHVRRTPGGRVRVLIMTAQSEELKSSEEPRSLDK